MGTTTETPFTLTPMLIEIWCTAGSLPAPTERRCGVCHTGRDVEPEFIGTCTVAYTCPAHRLTNEERG